jgi:hypothetical protein
MSTATVGNIPEVGQAVRVRNRLATVRAVEPYDTRTGSGRLDIVDVEYLDDWRYPESEQLLWEVEATGIVLGSTSLPGVDANRPDNPEALQSFVNAHRWTRLNRLRESDDIKDEPLVGVWNSANQVLAYQLEPVLKVLAMPRESLLLAMAWVSERRFRRGWSSKNSYCVGESAASLCSARRCSSGIGSTNGGGDLVP